MTKMARRIPFQLRRFFANQAGSALDHWGLGIGAPKAIGFTTESHDRLAGYAGLNQVRQLQQPSS
jgi:hypothetical protein